MERSPFEDVLAVQDEFHCPLQCPVFGWQTPSISCTTTEKPVDCLANYGKLIMEIRPGVETFAGVCLAATCSARTGDSCWAAWFMEGIQMRDWFHEDGYASLDLTLAPPEWLGLFSHIQFSYLQKSTPFLIVQLRRRLTFDSTHGVDVEWIVAHRFLCSKYPKLLNSTISSNIFQHFNFSNMCWTNANWKLDNECQQSCFLQTPIAHLSIIDTTKHGNQKGHFCCLGGQVVETCVFCERLHTTCCSDAEGDQKKPQWGE